MMPAPNPLASTLLAIAMIGVFALVVGAVIMWRRGGERRKPVLMLIAAAVALVNVLIWTI